MRIIRSHRAQRDIEAIWHYVAQNSVQNANRLLKAIEERMDLIAMFPRAGRARDEFGAGLRSTTVQKHLILYRVEADTIEIARVIHGAQNLDRLLDSDD